MTARRPIAEIAQVAGLQTKLDREAFWSPGRYWAFVGDSITNGSTTTAGHRFAELVPKLVGTVNMSMSSLISGVGGNKSVDVLARLDADVMAMGPEGICLLVGTNDASQGVSVATYSANVAAIAAACRDAGVPLVIGTVPPRAGVTDDVRGLIAAYNVWLRLWAPEHGVTLANVFGRLVDTTTGDLLAAYDSGDGVHPNNAGHWQVAQAFADAVAAVIPAQPGLVLSKTAFSIAPNPLMVGAGTKPTGFYEQPGGTGTAPTYSIVDDTTGTLAAGRWAQMDFDATAAGGTRILACVLKATGWAVGDTVLVCGQLDGTDEAGGYEAAYFGGTASISPYIANQSGVALFRPLNGCPSLVPGPIAYPFVIPAGTTGLMLYLSVLLPTGQHVSVRIGAADILNLTTLGVSEP